MSNVQSKTINEYELTPERKEQLLDYIAEKIDKFGLTTPAIIALESSKPFNLVLSTFVLGVSPIFKIFTNDKYSDEIVLLLEENGNIEKLIAKIELVDEQRRVDEKKKRKERKLFKKKKD